MAILSINLRSRIYPESFFGDDTAALLAYSILGWAFTGDRTTEPSTITLPGYEAGSYSSSSSRNGFELATGPPSSAGGS